MKKLLFIAVLFVSSALYFNSFAQSNDEVKEEKTEKVSETAASEEGKVFNTICPVSTEEADPEITYTYNGVTYAVCCNNCLKKFKNDPEKYISRLSEDGKSLKRKSEKKLETD